jgi:hypothetical protein
MGDVAVKVEGGLYEVDARYFDQQIAPRLGKQPNRFSPMPLTEPLAKGLLDVARRTRQANKLSLDDGAEASFLSLRRALPFASLKGLPPEKTTELAFTGLTCRLGATVSPDRRRIHLRITQEVTEIVEVQKIQMVEENGKETTLDHPLSRESSETTTVVIDDGLAVLVPLRWQPPSAKAANKVAFLLIQPLIWIEEEERARRKQ